MRAVLVLLLVACGVTPLASQESRDGPLYSGRPLVDVLQDLNRRGLRIVFSTSLVPVALRVSAEPTGTPREVLDQVLRPHGLYPRPGAQGVLIVARAPKRRADPVPATPARAARPPGGGEHAAPTTTVSGQGLDESQTPTTEVSLVVTDSAPIVDVQNAAVGTTFAGPMLRDIPNQRDVFALLAQTPGIAMPRLDIGGNTAGTQSPYRAYGLSGQSITTVDGVNITSGADNVGAYIDYGALAEANVTAAGNSAEVPVAGAAVSTVIKSGSNAHRGEAYADYKPGGDQPYDGAENYARYRDLNGQLGGPFVKDRFWYFTSFRDQYTELTTAMYDRPPEEGGTQGQPFSTQTTEYTVKLNYRLNDASTLTFMTQVGQKYQPYRGGSGAAAHQYTIESTARQDGWSHIGKAGYMQVLGTRATLDTSLNIYGNHFPLTAHTDKTPIIDDVTLARRGAFNTPAFSQDARRHYDANLTLYADRHDMKVGYMYQHYAPRFTAYGAPGPAGTAGHFFIVTTNRVPTSFWVDNGPVWNKNVLKNHALFFQDKFSVMARLTLNYGVRFEQHHSSYPEQRFGLNGEEPCTNDHDCTIGPFAAASVTPARDVVTFNTLVPRVALIYDPFGNARTALKASWGRFSTNPAASLAALVNPIDIITKKYAWDSNYLTADPAIAATRITPAYVATLGPIFGGSQLTPTTVDPNLRNSYTDELTFGVEQEIAGDLRASVTVIRKRQKNMFGRYDRLRTPPAYVPVRAVDPGPDGIVRTADDRAITVFETRLSADVTDFYLTNKPIGDTYGTIELGLTKRMNDNWQLASGFNRTTRDLSSQFSEDPNTVAWNSNNTRTTGWTFKASGSYVFNRGVLVSLSYNAMKGEPYGRLFTVTQPYLQMADPNRTTPLLQGNMTIVAEKAGTYYLPSLNVINLRAQKEFVIKSSQRLQLMLNIFNLTGARTVTGVEQTTSWQFNQPRANISGTVVRFGARYMF
jgi:hypothetical protein